MSQISFFIFLTLLISVGICDDTDHNLSDEQLDKLAHLDASRLSEDLRKFIEEYKNDNSHVCCANSYGPNYVPQTTSVLQFITISYESPYDAYCRGSTKGTCTRYALKYRQDIIYRLETVYQSVTLPCPDHLIVCCNGYLWVNKTCLPKDWVMANIGLLLQIYTPQDFQPPVWG